MIKKMTLLKKLEVFEWILYTKKNPGLSNFAEKVRIENGEVFIDNPDSWASFRARMMLNFAKPSEERGRSVRDRIWNEILSESSLTPYTVYQAARIVFDAGLDKHLTAGAMRIRKNPRDLTWNDLENIAFSILSPGGLAFFDNVYLAKNLQSPPARPLYMDCQRCWRIVPMNGKGKFLCPLHTGRAEYMRMYRLNKEKKIHAKLESLSLENRNTWMFFKDISYMLSQYPNVCSFLSKKGLDVTESSDEDSSIILKTLNEPGAIPTGDWMRSKFELLFMLPRAEIFLSVLDHSGRVLGSGGSRKGAGRPRRSLSPSCHPESLKLAEIEGDRAN